MKRFAVLAVVGACAPAPAPLAADGPPSTTAHPSDHPTAAATEHARLSAEHHCEQGAHQGCTAMGYALENGWGIESDPQRAQQFFAKGCALATAMCSGRVCWFAKDPCDRAARLTAPEP